MDDGAKERQSGEDRHSEFPDFGTFVSPDILRRQDVDTRRKKLASIVSSEIIPRLLDLHGATPALSVDRPMVPTQDDIVRLANLVVGPDVAPAGAFVVGMRDQGLAIEDLFVGLLEPAARHLGKLWEEDRCDFIDVTIGVARLQQMLAIYSRAYERPAFSAERRVLMASAPGEQHSFGTAMVARFLRAGGWDVQLEFGLAAQDVVTLLREQWFAVVGLTVAIDRHLGTLAETIREIRTASRNRGIGIMVGGPLFTRNPELVAEVGADSTAANAPAAVITAQLLFDNGVKRNWGRSDS